jgi:hypothetical protein
MILSKVYPPLILTTFLSNISLNFIITSQTQPSKWSFSTQKKKKKEEEEEEEEEEERKKERFPIKICMYCLPAF